LDENYKFHRKIYSRNYRLLSKYKQNKDSIITGLKKDISNNEVDEGKDICNNENERTGKKELSNKCSTRNIDIDKKFIKNKYCMFETKKYSNMEKKIFKELDYENFLKNNKTISDKTYKKIITKRYSLRLAIPVLLFLLLLILFVVDFSLGFSTNEVSWKGGLFGFSDFISNIDTEKGFLSTVIKWLRDNTPGFWQHYRKTAGTSVICNLCNAAEKKLDLKCILGQLFGYIIYFVPFIIFGVTFISWIIYYHNKVKKYNKLKSKKR
ncbi:Plasmodium exported protein (Pm-fam-a like), unknown function, partial [Plasmodium malariae]